MSAQQLNTVQKQAVTAPFGPIMVLAGAGSGKTRVLTNRIMYLVKYCEVMPRNILAITFTNKAAQEMKSRLLKWDSDAQYMTISTIHSFCAMVLRSQAQRLNRQSNFTIYADDDKKSVLKKVVNSLVDDVDGKFVDDVSNAISLFKNNATNLSRLVDSGDNSIFDQSQEDIAYQRGMDSCSRHIEEVGEDKFKEIISSYQSSLQGSNAMDFDDLLYYVHELFSTCPEVLEYYQNMYQHILIDEFQDTNKVQYEIFRMMAQGHNNIFVVGDDDQSIYSWRGADINNLLSFNKDFPTVTVFKLEQNYRSTKKILDVANAVISKNTDRFDKVLFTENESGVKVEQFSAYSEQDESYYVVQQIASLKRSNGYTNRDFAILMRINALSRTHEQQLNRAGIAYRVFGGFKFFDRKEVKDVLSYLRLIDNRYDNQAFIRCLNVPYKRGIGDTTIERLLALSADMGLPIVDIISDQRNLEGVVNSGIQKKLIDFYQLYVGMVEYSHTNNVASLMREVIHLAKFREYYKEIDDVDRSINIDELEQSTLDYCYNMGELATLSNYLQNVALSTDKDDDDNGDYVTIATIHAVKGLEFKTVFIVGLEEGIFPSSRSTYDNKDLQEERRLMYVAITRARQRLYLTHAQSRYMYGRRSNNMSSCYYSEISKLLRPRPVVTESMLADDRVLDRLNRTNDNYAPVQPKVNVNMSPYKVGQKVSHNMFGKGMIININGTKVDIMFATFGKKCLDFNIAKITID